MNIINIGDDDVIKVGDQINDYLVRGSIFKADINKDKEIMIKTLNENDYWTYKDSNYLEDKRDKKYNRLITNFTRIEENLVNQVIIEKQVEFVRANFLSWQKLNILINFGVIFSEKTDVNQESKTNNYSPIIQLVKDDIIDLGNNKLITGYWFLDEIKDLFRYIMGEIYKQRKFNLVMKENNQEICTEILENEECEFLQLGSGGWKTGKIQYKISLQLIPESPEITEYESPLDAIREMIKNGEINCD